MKCPFRKQIYHYAGHDDEEFMGCYGEDCPYFIPEGVMGTASYCKKNRKRIRSSCVSERRFMCSFG